jgi:hypothetical protein
LRLQLKSRVVRSRVMRLLLEGVMVVVFFAYEFIIFVDVFHVNVLAFFDYFWVCLVDSCFQPAEVSRNFLKSSFYRGVPL